MSEHEWHEWVDENLANTIQFIESEEIFGEPFTQELTALAVAVDEMGLDEPIEYMLDLFTLDIAYLEEAIGIFESARVDEVQDQPDPCAGHRDLADGTCSCYKE